MFKKCMVKISFDKIKKNVFREVFFKNYISIKPVKHIKMADISYVFS